VIAVVLIVTDETLLADLLTEALRPQGFRLVAVASESAALETFRRERAVMSLLDLRHREALGILRELQRADPRAAIMVLTGEDVREQEEEARRAGVTDVLSRHDGLGSLAHRINEALSEPSGALVSQSPPAPASVADEPPGIVRRPTSEASPLLMVDEPVRILVVDDNVGIQHLVTRALTREGYVVAAVGDGEAALEHLAQEPARLVILDLQLPRLGGLGVLRRLRQQSSPPPVIVMSGLHDTHLAQEAVALGACDYISKPLDIERLCVAVRAALVLGESRRGPLWKRLWG
jgi:DNA-binding response OmpR family regulator